MRPSRLCPTLPSTLRDPIEHRTKARHSGQCLSPSAIPSCLRPTLSVHWNRIEHWAKARHFVARFVDFKSSSSSGGLDLSSASSASALGGIHSVGVPGAVVPCFEPLIGFALEPVCGAELFALHSINPLEPD